MELPPIDKSLLAKMGIPETTIPGKPAVDFGVNIESPKPQVEEPLTTEKCIKLFGAREAVMMNFIPQMLTALALEQAEGFINYCRDHRISEFKRHNREMRSCIKEYNYELRASYGESWYAYQNYLERLRKTVEFDLFKC